MYTGAWSYTYMYRAHVPSSMVEGLQLTPNMQASLKEHQTYAHLHARTRARIRHTNIHACGKLNNRSDPLNSVDGTYVTVSVWADTTWTSVRSAGIEWAATAFALVLAWHSFARAAVARIVGVRERIAKIVRLSETQRRNRNDVVRRSQVPIPFPHFTYQ